MIEAEHDAGERDNQACCSLQALSFIMAGSSQACMGCTGQACSLTCNVNRLASFSRLPSKVPWSCTDRLVTWSARLHNTTYAIIVLLCAYLLIRIRSKLGATNAWLPQHLLYTCLCTQLIALLKHASYNDTQACSSVMHCMHLPRHLNPCGDGNNHHHPQSH